MLTAIGMIGGAAAARVFSKDGKKLAKKEKEYQTYIAGLKSQLAEEQQLCQQKEQQIFEVEKQLTIAEQKAQELSQQTEALAQEKAQLEVEKKTLVLERLLLSRCNQELEEKTQQLTIEKEELNKQVLQLQQEKQEYEATLERLKNSVSDVLQRLFAKSITEHEATSLLNELGCSVEYVEAPVLEAVLAEEGPKEPSQKSRAAPLIEWDGKTRLFLDDKERIHKLVASCMAARSSKAVLALEAGSSTSTSSAANSDSSSTPSKVPVVTFPQLKASLPPLVMVNPLQPLRRLTDGSSSPRTADVAHRDQVQPPPQQQQQPAQQQTSQKKLSFVEAAPGKKSGPAASSKPAISLVQPTQAKRSDDWGLPSAEEGFKSAFSFLTGSPSKLLGNKDSFDEDSISGNKSLVRAMAGGM
mmetsp:Transcript_5215/g.11390  ORF Transcript_5215/g.11390 Transcript_5215/m.11390 type:complete len:413 (+) Transcript_5215:78-1316(+)